MRENDFNCIDVETANGSAASICQIGLVIVRSGKIAETWDRLVNPKADFSSFNVGIHRITADHVRDSPELPDIWDELRKLTENRPLVYHSHARFDRNALTQAAGKHGLPQLDVEWVDSTRIVRDVWPERYGKRGFGLANLARDFEIEFQHHDGLEDATATALITLEALKDSRTSIREWAQDLPSSRARAQTRPERESKGPGKKVKKDSANDQLVGHRIVFTGRLAVTRKEAKRMAEEAGGEVDDNVQHATTMLVVGEVTTASQADTKTVSKTGKQTESERRIEAGQEIAILAEREFWNLLRRTT